jgi:hypothetical protein
LNSIFLSFKLKLGFKGDIIIPIKVENKGVEMRKTYIFLLILAVSFLLTYCGEDSPSSPMSTTTSTTTTTVATTTATAYPVTIRETGEGFYTITDALAAAVDGQHIDVSAGTYEENFTVDKIIHFEGENKNTTIIKNIDPNANEVVRFESGASGGSIRKFTITDAYYGVYCTAAADVAIVNNIIGGNSYGDIDSNNSSPSISGNTLNGSAASMAGVSLSGAGAGRATVGENNIQNSGTGVNISSCSPVIVSNTIINNYHGVENINYANADLGGGTGGSTGNNVIQHSGAVGWDLRNQTSNAIKAENNRWTHTTTAEIDAQDIYDDDENASCGAVDFVPFKTSVYFASLRMNPRLLSPSSLFKGFFRSLFRGDLPASAVYLSCSFQGRLYFARRELLLARYHSLADDCYYPPLMVRARR